MSTAAELGSTASSLEELTRRIESAADQLVGTPREDLGLGLMEVERSLRTASRRLNRLLAELRETSL